MAKPLLCVWVVCVLAARDMTFSRASKLLVRAMLRVIYCMLALSACVAAAMTPASAPPPAPPPALAVPQPWLSPSHDRTARPISRARLCPLSLSRPAHYSTPHAAEPECHVMPS